MRFSSLADWLGWLEKSHPTEIELGLARIRQVAERLQLLDPTSKVITVAGTNGKGSCVTACAALLRASGFSVGVYTSPHLLYYAERIQVDGKPVSDESICGAFEKIADAAGDISLTYFEYGTLAALEIFNQRNVDYMVLEVGLGGRLDAINIIDADVAVITTIALDHQDWLGDTRELIGYEKAGILRAGKIFICADQEPPQSVIDVAANLKTQSYFIAQDFTYNLDGKHWQWSGKTLRGDRINLPAMTTPHLPLPSMAAALQVLYLLDVQLPTSIIEKTLATLTLAGRFQKIVYQDREFILDVAHNPAATKYLAQRLQSEACSGKIHALVAMMADKDCAESLANLTTIIDSWNLVDLTHIPRAASPDALAKHLSTLNVSVQAHGEMNSLIDRLLNTSVKGDRILVFGSFYTVAAALLYLQAKVHH